jgi:hypothetical protein
MQRLGPTPAAPVTFIRWQPSSWVLVLQAALAMGLAMGLVASLLWDRSPLSRYEYHLWRWQADTFLSSAFSIMGIGPDPGGEDGRASLEQYFRITSALRGAEQQAAPDLALIDALTNERAAYENDVERLIEGYIGEAVAEAGLQTGLPLFGDMAITWPPVDIELTSPPTLLVRSPRDEIKRDGDTLLKNDLSLREIEAIEERTDSEDQVSIVVAIGGLAAYPAIVRDDRSYDSLLETSAHEWVHHYLAFHPLGEQWGTGGDAETLNETTADLAGRELANLVRARHPVEFEQGQDGRAPAGQAAATVDFNKEMRELRLAVDALLAAGDVTGAERLMEDKRQFFDENGIPIRKLNQAYFAFYGTYAAGAASSNPIGPKIDRVWELTKDVGVFLTLMREVETQAELDELLAKLER